MTEVILVQQINQEDEAYAEVNLGQKPDQRHRFKRHHKLILNAWMIKRNSLLPSGDGS